jgi:hypothetical protein
VKKFALLLAMICLSCEPTWADILLSTTQPIGNPLIMSAGTTSGPMFVTVASDNPGQDVMSAWLIQLEIAPLAGAGGTLSFNDPVSGSVNDPANYVFGTDGYGIVASNTGNSVGANDFFFDGNLPGATVSNATLLEIDFLSSSSATGLFGIYAVEGAGLTEWSDGSASTQYFSNVPDGSGTVLIGEVLIAGQAVPEPTSATLFGIPAAISVIYCLYRRKMQHSERIILLRQEPTPKRS